MNNRISPEWVDLSHCLILGDGDDISPNRVYIFMIKDSFQCPKGKRLEVTALKDMGRSDAIMVIQVPIIIEPYL